MLLLLVVMLLLRRHPPHGGAELVESRSEEFEYLGDLHQLVRVELPTCGHAEVNQSYGTSSVIPDGVGPVVFPINCGRDRLRVLHTLKQVVQELVLVGLDDLIDILSGWLGACGGQHQTELV